MWDNVQGHQTSGGLLRLPPYPFCSVPQLHCALWSIESDAVRFVGLSPVNFFFFALGKSTVISSKVTATQVDRGAARHYIATSVAGWLYLIKSQKFMNISHARL